MSEPLLFEIWDLQKWYTNGGTKIRVLHGVNLSVRRGESIAVTGPSGVGKTTLLHILGLLDSPGGGGLKLDGMDVLRMTEAERARLRNSCIGFVFQFFQLLPEFSALENVSMPGLIAGQDSKHTTRKSMDLLNEVGLGHCWNRRPGELSGGEQQRVAIARALVNEPDVVLADEPTGNLDPATGQDIENLLKQLNRTRNTTLIVVTHKESLAKTMDRRVGLVQGKLKELQ